MCTCQGAGKAEEAEAPRLKDLKGKGKAKAEDAEDAEDADEEDEEEGDFDEVWQSAHLQSKIARGSNFTPVTRSDAWA